MAGILIELRGQCSGCGNPLPINALVPQVACPVCQRITPFGAEIWNTLLEDAISETRGLAVGEGRNTTLMTGVGTFQLQYGRLEPRCEACKTDVAMRFVHTHASRGFVACVGCGRWLSARALPPGLDSIVFKRVQYVIGEDTSQFSTGEPGLQTPAGTEPVIFQCPQCGGALRVDGSTRTVPCEYCRSNLYLPDDLWNRLHPVKTVQRWFLWYNDQPRSGCQIVDVRASFPRSTYKNGEIREWHVEEGQQVAQGQLLVTLEDEEDHESRITAPVGGMIHERFKGVFDDVIEGEVLCRIESPLEQR